MPDLKKKVENTVNPVGADGTYWYPMKDVAALLGDKNPRQMVDTLREEAQERKFPGKDTGGRNVQIIHISEASVRILLARKGMNNDPVVLAALGLAPEADLPRDVQESVPVVQVAEEPAGGTIGTEPTPPARKNKKKTLNAIKISKEDYARLKGISLTTVYNHVKKNTFRVRSRAIP